VRTSRAEQRKPGCRGRVAGLVGRWGVVAVVRREVVGAAKQREPLGNCKRRLPVARPVPRCALATSPWGPPRTPAPRPDGTWASTHVRTRRRPEGWWPPQVGDLCPPWAQRPWLPLALWVGRQQSFSWKRCSCCTV